MAAGAHVAPGLFDAHDGDDGGEVNSPRVTHDVQVCAIQIAAYEYIYQMYMDLSNIYNISILNE